MNSICSKLCHYIVIFHALAALVIGAIALAVPHWFARGNGGSAGLFELCPNGLQCALGDNNTTLLLNAVRGLLAASLGVNFFAIITLIHGKVKGSKSCQYAGSGLLLSAGCVSTAGLAVFTVFFLQLSSGLFLDNDVVKGYCYAIAWVAAGLSVVFGIFGLILLPKDPAV